MIISEQYLRSFIRSKLLEEAFLSSDVKSLEKVKLPGGLTLQAIGYIAPKQFDKFDHVLVYSKKSDDKKIIDNTDKGFERLFDNMTYEIKNSPDDKKSDFFMVQLKNDMTAYAIPLATKGLELVTSDLKTGRASPADYAVEVLSLAGATPVYGNIADIVAALLAIVKNPPNYIFALLSLLFAIPGLGVLLKLGQAPVEKAVKELAEEGFEELSEESLKVCYSIIFKKRKNIEITEDDWIDYSYGDLNDPKKIAEIERILAHEATVLKQEKDRIFEYIESIEDVTLKTLDIDPKLLDERLNELDDAFERLIDRMHKKTVQNNPSLKKKAASLADETRKLTPKMRENAKRMFTRGLAQMSDAITDEVIEKAPRKLAEELSGRSKRMNPDAFQRMMYACTQDIFKNVKVSVAGKNLKLNFDSLESYSKSLDTFCEINKINKKEVFASMLSDIEKMSKEQVEEYFKFSRSDLNRMLTVFINKIEGMNYIALPDEIAKSPGAGGLFDGDVTVAFLASQNADNLSTVALHEFTHAMDRHFISAFVATKPLLGKTLKSSAPGRFADLVNPGKNIDQLSKTIYSSLFKGKYPHGNYGPLAYDSIYKNYAGKSFEEIQKLFSKKVPDLDQYWIDLMSYTVSKNKNIHTGFGLDYLINPTEMYVRFIGFGSRAADAGIDITNIKELGKSFIEMDRGKFIEFMPDAGAVQEFMHEVLSNPRKYNKEFYTKTLKLVHQIVNT